MGFPWNSLAGREVCAYLVSQALGFGLVPFTLLRDGPLGPGSLQQYIEHNPNYHYFTFKPADLARLRPVALFDLLINNADRKGSHILVQKRTRKLYLIDHGLCFHAEDKLRTVVWDFAGEPIPADLLSALSIISLASRGTWRPACESRTVSQPGRNNRSSSREPRHFSHPVNIPSRLRTGGRFLTRLYDLPGFLSTLALKHRKTGECMPHYNLALLGFGNVGRALAILLGRKESDLQHRYGITFKVTGIATMHHGAAIDPAGLDFINAVDLVETGESLAALSTIPVKDNFHFLHSCGANVLFENTPVNHLTGQPAIDHLHLALELGMHAITANKGPVVHAYRTLTDFAKAQNKKFYFESTVMDGAPIFSLFRSTLPGADLLGFRGILNSTTNLILGRMETGESFDDAVKYTQSVGLAETNPAADVDGWDAAIKVASLITVLMDIPFTPQQVDRTGIRQITPQMVVQAKNQGSRWKLVCSAERDGNSVKGRVAPELVDSSSPFYGLEGSSSIVEFQTDMLSHLSIIEGNPGPETTAYGLLADFINAVRSVV